MKATKFDVLNQKQTALEQGIAKRIIEIYSELTNLRFVVNSMANFISKDLPTVYEKEILDKLPEYYLISDSKVIHVPTGEFFNIELVTAKHSLQPVEEGSNTFSFLYNGIITDENSALEKNHTFEAVNEQHAWQLLREVIIQELTNKTSVVA